MARDEPGSSFAVEPGRRQGSGDPESDARGSSVVRAVASRRTLLRLAPYVLLILLVLLAVAFSIDLPGTFATGSTVRIMITSQTVLLLLSVALLFPLRCGDFDLTISATMVFSGSLIAVMTAQHHVNAVEAAVVGVGLGVLIGLVNAFFVVGLGIDAFIVTLGVMTALTGLSYAVTGSSVVTGVPTSLLNFSRDKLLGLPASAYYAWIAALIALYLFEFTPFGRYLLFVGGNRDAARLSGLKVKRYRTISFVLSGGISGFAGLVLVGTLGAVDPSIGSQYLLQPYAACFLGTAAIAIGRFNVIGMLVALYFLIVGVTGLELMGAEQWVSDVFNGAALVVAVTFAWLTGRLGTRVRRRAT
jgi:ribose transport system permease protein